MRNRPKQLTACIDANVLISAIAFGGKPLKVVERAFNREFLIVTGANILLEVRKNLLGKLALNKDRVDWFLSDISAVSSVFVATGAVDVTANSGDNLVLEVALMGGADVLVTTSTFIESGFEPHPSKLSMKSTYCARPDFTSEPP